MYPVTLLTVLTNNTYRSKALEVHLYIKMYINFVKNLSQPPSVFKLQHDWRVKIVLIMQLSPINETQYSPKE